jgi:hypothetical protein
VFGDATCRSARTTWIFANNCAGKRGDALLVEFRLSFLPPFRLALAPIGVRQPFCFGPFDRLSLDENTPALMPFPRSAPL